MAPKSVTFRRHDHLVSVLFGDLLSHSYNITFSMFLDLVNRVLLNIVHCTTDSRLSNLFLQGFFRVWGWCGIYMSRPVMLDTESYSSVSNCVYRQL